MLRTIGRSGICRRFLRGILNIELCLGCLIPVSVFVLGGVLGTGIPETRKDSTAPRVGRMERISRSRFRRACRLWCGVCVWGGGGRRDIGAILPGAVLLLCTDWAL